MLHAASSPALDPVIDITDGTLDRMTQVKDRLLAPDDLTEVRSGDTITLGFVELTLAGPREFFSLVSRLFLE